MMFCGVLSHFGPSVSGTAKIELAYLLALVCLYQKAREDFERIAAGQFDTFRSVSPGSDYRISFPRIEPPPLKWSDSKYG